MLGTRAAELAVCRELLLSSRAIASLFSFERPVLEPDLNDSHIQPCLAHKLLTHLF